MADDLGKIKREDALRIHDRSRAFQDMVNQAAVKSGEVAIRAAMLMNGGAAISVLAFIGGLVGQGKVTVKQVGDISSSLLWFAFGVVVAGASLAFSYFTNYAHNRLENSKILTWQPPYIVEGPATPKWWFWANLVHVLAILTGIVSLILFVVGMLDVRNSIVRLGN